MQRTLEKGESIIICSAHYGNWEWGMLALGMNLSTAKYVIYKPLNNKVFDEWFYNMRTRFGNSLSYHEANHAHSYRNKKYNFSILLRI